MIEDVLAWWVSSAMVMAPVGAVGCYFADAQTGLLAGTLYLCAWTIRRRDA